MLLRRTIARARRDFALSIDDTLPRYIIGTHCHGVTDNARVTALANQVGYITVRSDFAAWNLAHNVVDMGEKRAGLWVVLHVLIILAPKKHGKRGVGDAIMIFIRFARRFIRFMRRCREPDQN